MIRGPTPLAGTTELCLLLRGAVTARHQASITTEDFGGTSDKPPRLLHGYLALLICSVEGSTEHLRTERLINRILRRHFQACRTDTE